MIVNKWLVIGTMRETFDEEILSMCDDQEVAYNKATRLCQNTQRYVRCYIRNLPLSEIEILKIYELWGYRDAWEGQPMVEVVPPECQDHYMKGYTDGREEMKNFGKGSEE